MSGARCLERPARPAGRAAGASPGGVADGPVRVRTTHGRRVVVARAQRAFARV